MILSGLAWKWGSRTSVACLVISLTLAWHTLTTGMSLWQYLDTLSPLANTSESRLCTRWHGWMMDEQDMNNTFLAPLLTDWNLLSPCCLPLRSATSLARLEATSSSSNACSSGAGYSGPYSWSANCRGGQQVSVALEPQFGTLQSLKDSYPNSREKRNALFVKIARTMMTHWLNKGGCSWTAITLVVLLSWFSESLERELQMMS